MKTIFEYYPKIQQIRIMSRCNNSCRFCMVENEIRHSKHLSFKELKKIVDKFDSKREIDLFGGEPTLHPHFLELLKYIHRLGFLITIATNARKFSDKHFAEKIVKFRIKSIRTSLYGENEKTHDWYTNALGSYKETCDGIKKLSELGIKVTVNILIMSKNVYALNSIVDKISELGACRVKFSMLMDGLTNSEHLVSLAEFRKNVNRAIERAINNNLEWALEKAPYCVSPKYINNFTYERALNLLNRTFDDENVCKECYLRKWCYGLDAGYVKKKGFSGIYPISYDQISGRVIRNIGDISDFHPKTYRLNLISINSELLKNPLFQKKLEEKIEDARKEFSAIGIVL